MWPDNETSVDLLGFDVLVDELVVALTDGRLLPLTVGVLGGWGSGKSSLLKQAYDELSAGGAQSPHICVEFSPWKYEDYEDVKAALMRAVLDACQSRAVGDDDRIEEIGKLRRFARNFGRRGRAVGRFAVTAGPTVAPAVLAAFDPHAAQATVDMTSGLTSSAAPIVASMLADSPADTDEAESTADIHDINEFRQLYANMVQCLPDVETIIVFIDDLDRCLPETIVDTFEAIRLFLNAPKTAYVIAANRQIIEAAIDSRYRQLQMDDGRKVGHEYLEKMLQLQISVPSLSAIETAAYVSLLVTELHLDADDFAEACELVRQRRAAAPFAAVYNSHLAGEVLGTLLNSDLAADLRWANDISPALAEGFAGNPRSIKRFLNDLRWRQRAAARRLVTLQSDVLAKLMVLGERHSADLQIVFDWQHQANGPATELAAAESLARSFGEGAIPGQRPGVRPSETGSADSGQIDRTGVSDQVRDWINRPEIRRWLLIPPDLSLIDLRPYFTYFREHIVVGSPASALRPELQALLSRLSSEVLAVARQAITDFAGLSQPDQDDLALAFLDVVSRRPDSQAFSTAAELAGRVPRLVRAVCDSLGRIPHASLAPLRLPGVFRRLPEGPESSALLAGWAGSHVDGIRAAGTAAGRPQARG